MHNALDPRLSFIERGSTVRVRQRALQTPCQLRLYSSDWLAHAPGCSGYEPFMELPGPERPTSEVEAEMTSSHAEGPRPPRWVRRARARSLSRLAVRAYNGAAVD